MILECQVTWKYAAMPDDAFLHYGYGNDPYCPDGDPHCGCEGFVPAFPGAQGGGAASVGGLWKRRAEIAIGRPMSRPDLAIRVRQRTSQAKTNCSTAVSSSED